MIKIRSNRIILKDKIISGYVYIDRGKIIEISSLDKRCDLEFDFSNGILSPGCIDIHTHGAGGYPFINATEDDVVHACNFHLKNGTTSIVPTISASEFNSMAKAVETIHYAKDNIRLKANILGAHLEGPYLSKEQCGAQCSKYITYPKFEDYSSLIYKYGKDISRWTFAPENDIEGNFCSFLSKHNIIPSIGHSAANYDDVKVAIENGANLVTHLYSCTSTVTRRFGFRSLGVIESCFLRDELYAEIIADGKHLPVDLIKMILKIKGVDKTIAVTDSLEIAGTNIKEGVMSGTEYIVEDGVCKLKDRSAFAGSVATGKDLVKTLVNDCNLSYVDAFKLLSYNPAKLLKINKGSIEKGYDADLVVYNKNLDIKSVFVSGKQVSLESLYL